LPVGGAADRKRRIEELTKHVWVDVGGTFTDCFLSDPASPSTGRRCLKVLSSGLVRAEVSRADGSRHLWIQFASADQNAQRITGQPREWVEDFWVGADVTLLDEPSGGERATYPLGKIMRQATSGECWLSGVAGTGEAGLPLRPGAIVEIDAHIEAPVLATRWLLGTPLSEPLPTLDVRLGTTRGTNALLTRSGCSTALLVTRGFGDVLRIGQQERPELFALDIRKPEPLAQYVVEVDERLDAAGNVLQPLVATQLKPELDRLLAAGVESLAICFLHAHVNDAHEQEALAIAQQVGFRDVSCSSEVAPLIKLVSRAETTTLDAYLNPILRGYVDRLQRQFGGPTQCRLRLMTSNGNLVSPAAFRGRDSILSGPAGGVVALAHVARHAGAEAAIGLDMGGTSTDVSRFQGRVGRRNESRISGIRVMTPMMDIQTVAAGGGSICRVVDGRLSVGPGSAGADPGPACYGRGGPLTITDVNLLLGRLPADRFPFPLDIAAARRRLREIAHAQTQLTEQIADGDADSETTALKLAAGFLQIAVTHMAEAVRTISTAEGSDVRQMALVGFGGAAGGHLCRIAENLQMHRILDHPQAAVLSALGLGLAEVGRVVTRGVYRIIDPVLLDSLPALVKEMRHEAENQLRLEQTVSELTSPQFDFQCDLRLVGTESGLSLSLEPYHTLTSRFHLQHRETFGYDRPYVEVELVSVRCEATLASGEQQRPADIKQADPHAQPTRQTRIWCDNRWLEAPLIDRAGIATGRQIVGPAMIASDQSTLVIEPDWRGKVLGDGTIELRPAKCSFEPLANDGPGETEFVPASTPVDVSALAPLGESNSISDPQHDPILLEVVARRLQGIADSMGEVLRRTAVSVNVKERRDYSCAVFRGDGSLIANAPHVPVHLGAMGHTVRRIIRDFESMAPGDCYLTNDPFAGGSHLPDVTVVTPVFCRPSPMQRPNFFVASRAHHAEIGGRTPGSMPPDATNLAEEGVVLRPFALVKDGVHHEDELRRQLASGPYPSRCIAENLADIAAQQAAGIFGANALRELTQLYSVESIDALMGRLLDVAGEGVAKWIEQLSTSPLCFADALDDGSPIVVRLQRHGARLEIDFTGTAGVHPQGFNATPSIVTAAVLYVLRCVSGSNLPLCDGVLRQIDLRIPPGLLNPPAHLDPSQCAAVVAGNVETSQRVVDVLLGALGAAAASQGTMNNLLLGDETFGYYETIGGGSGATAQGRGADAVHTHMTNTLITDPEVLELRLPVRLHRFQIRPGSGGAGRHRGGDGIIRELEFLKPLTVSLISGRRTRAPYAMAGGQEGRCGINQWIHQGETTVMPPWATWQVATGDRLVIQTPGGGGWGASG